MAEQATERTGVPVVFTTNYPLFYFTERIAGDRVKLVFPAPADVDPAEWMPEDAIIRGFQEADLILLNGAGYEAWVERVSLPATALVDTTAGLRERFIEITEAVTHSHGPHGLHTHAGTAFTTWLDPRLATEQARAIRDALIRLLPEQAEDFTARFDRLAVDLVALDTSLEEAFGSRPGEPLLASHPVYQYLEARYALNLRSLHWEPDEVPEEEEWAELDRLLAEQPARFMVWEDEPLAETADRLTERGVAVITYNPGAQPPEEGDWLALMRENAARVQAALGRP